MPSTEKRARLLLERGRATRVGRRCPFTIRLVDRTAEESVSQPVRIKMDPGSKTTGLAVVCEAAGETVVIVLAELHQRGARIRDRLSARRPFRRRRRSKPRTGRAASVIAIVAKAGCRRLYTIGCKP
jgi:hypothetical protein